MKITFSVTEESSVDAEEICEGIFDVENWTSFEGYGPLPGVNRATMTLPDGNRVGTVFSVENLDGSSHKEIVEACDPEVALTLRMYDFSPPLSRIATHIVEKWDFGRIRTKRQIRREFELYPKSFFWFFPLWVISLLLRRAVSRHTRMIANPSANHNATSSL